MRWRELFLVAFLSIAVFETLANVGAFYFIRSQVSFKEYEQDPVHDDNHASHMHTLACSL